MAQPVFEEHPLQDYFRESGEDILLMPGVDLDFATKQQSPYLHDLHSFWLYTFIKQLFQLVKSKSQRQTNAFAERFKYNVISSSLLASAVASTHTHSRRRSYSPYLPGKLIQSSPVDEPTHPSQSSDVFADSHWPLTLAYMAVVAFVAESFILFTILVDTGFFFFHKSKIEKSVSPEAMTASFNALDELIIAGNIWDSAVNEAITILEGEEENTFYGSTTNSSPAMALRISLQSSLHTTQNQCDNIRQLFSALTSPSELAPLVEMYAPRTPVKANSDKQTVRPHSIPVMSQRKTSTPDKRSTWNGSYATLAPAGSPTMQMSKRRVKRRSDLSGLFALNIDSEPTTPNLQCVREETPSSAPPERPYFATEDTFGVAALGLRRKSISIFGKFNDGRQSTFPSPSRFTLMQTSHHHLSLSALNMALQGAIAARRYACSYLLALRFEEEEEYWEDVRSVIALLTSTLVDASSRLMEALDEAENKRIKDEIPNSASETVSEEPSPITSLSHLRSSSWGSSPSPLSEKKRFRRVEEMVSFAPVPSHLSRFVAHVDAFSSALNDARDNLEKCVASLREANYDTGLPYLKETGAPKLSQTVAMEAYERLRKDLGLALRECERGREQFLEVIRPDHGTETEFDETDEVPALGQDNGTDESEERSSEPISAPLPSPPFVEDTYLDDVTAHLLSTTSSQHLPPIGAEQVFEAETPAEDGVGQFTRERSKLTREQRIALAKSRREHQNDATPSIQHSIADPDAVVQNRLRRVLGPSGEVVQELKDVIRKVGERKRLMTEQLLLSTSTSTTPSSLEEDDDDTPRRIPSPFTRLDS